MLFGMPVSGLMVEIQPRKVPPHLDQFLALWCIWSMRAPRGTRAGIYSTWSRIPQIAPLYIEVYRNFSLVDLVGVGYSILKISVTTLSRLNS